MFHDDILLLTGRRIVVPFHALVVPADRNYGHRRSHPHVFASRRFGQASVNTSPCVRPQVLPKEKRNLDRLITLVGVHYKLRVK